MSKNEGRKRRTCENCGVLKEITEYKSVHGRVCKDCQGQPRTRGIPDSEGIPCSGSLSEHHLNLEDL